MPDYIDREAMLEQIERRERVMIGKKVKVISTDALKQFVLNRPAADVAPVVRGHWLTWDEKFPDRATGKNLGVFCSACGNHADYSSPYCPNCGAKLNEEDENDQSND